MADTQAIHVIEAIYEHVDKHVRELLPSAPGAEVDDALMLLSGAAVTTDGTFGGDSTMAAAVIATGIAGCWSFDFKARITGWYIQEFDGTTGSIVLALEKAPRGASPSFASIAASAPPTVTSGRYGEDATLTGWDVYIDRGDLIRLSVTSVSLFTRLLVGLRVRRLEPYG